MRPLRLKIFAPFAAFAIKFSVDIKQFITLAPYTTLQVGGPARYFTEITHESELTEALGFAANQSLPIFILGGGSNLVIPDEGFPGLVIRISIRGIDWADDGDNVTAIAGSGEEWDAFVEAAVDRGLSGIECLSGIPGLVGGTPVQNVGAYGQEVSETIRSVRAYDRQLKRIVELSNPECGFRYRTSIFNTTGRDRYIVLAVTFSLSRGGKPAIRYPDLQRYFAGHSVPPTIRETRAAVLEIRTGKGMVIVPGDPDCRSAGSFFKNPILIDEFFESLEMHCRNQGMITESESIPKFIAGEGQVKVPAAWLIEKAGFAKGYRKGRAAISSKHTLAIVNLGGATASEVLALAEEIRERVEEVFGIGLKYEPEILH